MQHSGKLCVKMVSTADISCAAIEASGIQVSYCVTKPIVRIRYHMYMKVYYLTWSVAARQKNLCVQYNCFGLGACAIPGVLVRRLPPCPAARLYGANRCRTSACNVPRVLVEHDGWGLLLSAGDVLHSSSAASLNDLANSFRSMSTINKERFKTCAKFTDGRWCHMCVCSPFQVIRHI